MRFAEFKQVFQRQVSDLLSRQQTLFTTSVDKDVLWEVYLDSFPPGTNEVYRERRDHDCSCCKAFVRAFGNVVALVDNRPISIWDIEGAGSTYQPVVDALAAMVKFHPVADVFVTKESAFGTDLNRVQNGDGTVHTWHHFRVELPKHLVTRSARSEADLRGDHRTTRDVFKRSLEELSTDALETVLDLIAEDSLYKGEEWQPVLSKFAQLQTEYHALPVNEKDNYCWSKSVEVGGAMARIRNHSIGVLLQDITDGRDILEAVRRYEHFVAPENYKRPKPIFTRKMVEEAQATVERLGLVQSLGRRHARLSDVTVNNVLFADRDAKPVMGGGSGVFEALMQDVVVNPRQFERVPGVGVKQFVIGALPIAAQLEVLFENRHQPNLVSLIAPEDMTAPGLFKWDNPFSWAYAGNIADSTMKQRVKMAGGDVEGVLRFSIQWNENGDNQNDFDAHCKEPNGNHIWFSNKGRRHRSTGMLDVDIISPGRNVAVENITWTDVDRMLEGEYGLYVHNYSHNGGKSGFAAEIEYNGEIREYHYERELRQGEKVTVARIKFSRATGIEFVEELPSTTSSKDVWGLATNRWQRVSLACYSPNYWNQQQGIGHRHYFFMLAGAENDAQPNGFFNEYLKEELLRQKRVFAALGSKMRVPRADDQLSGLGFSATKRNSLVARVDGNRVVRVVF